MLQTHTRHTNTVVALAKAETEVKLELQVGARLTENEFTDWSQVNRKFGCGEIASFRQRRMIAPPHPTPLC